MDQKCGLCLMQRRINSLGNLQRKILMNICAAINKGEIRCRRYNSKFNNIFKEQAVIASIKSWKIRWLGHQMRTHEKEIPRRLIWGDQWRLGWPKLRWLDGMMGDLTALAVRNWRRKTQNRNILKKIVEGARTHPRLYWTWWWW
jgi:hypothetical protein